MSCLQYNYYDRIATTGSILAADIAGINPEIIPIKIQIEIAKESIPEEM